MRRDGARAAAAPSQGSAQPGEGKTCSIAHATSSNRADNCIRPQSHAFAAVLLVLHELLANCKCAAATSHAAFLPSNITPRHRT